MQDTRTTYNCTCIRYKDTRQSLLDINGQTRCLSAIGRSLPHLPQLYAIEIEIEIEKTYKTGVEIKSSGRRRGLGCQNGR